MERRKNLLFLIILLLTLVNFFSIFLYEKIKDLGRERPEFYIYLKSDSPEEEKIQTENKKAENKKIVKEKKEEYKNILVIGDSNVFIMYNSLTEEERRGAYFIAKIGVGTNFISDSFKINLEGCNEYNSVNTVSKTEDIDIISEVDKLKIGSIFVLLGINTPSKVAADTMVALLENLSKKIEKKIYVLSTLPYLDKGRYSLNMSDILAYNEELRVKTVNSDLQYLDLGSFVSGMNNYKEKTIDGIHYSEDIYKEIYNEMLSISRQNEDNIN